MTEMLDLPARVHEKIIRQVVPNVSDEILDEIVFNYLFTNPLCYEFWWDVISKSNLVVSKKDIDNLYVRVAERVLNSSDLIREALLKVLLFVVGMILRI